MDARVLASTPIVFVGRDGSTQHAPLVTAAVGGIDTMFVLDSGSDVHILIKELVDLLGLDVEEGEEGVDHSGATMPSWSVDDVSLDLGEAEVTLREIVSIPAPAPFPGLGIGGILSPQHLHPTATTVIDLAAAELSLVEGTGDAVARWVAARGTDRTTLELARDPQFATPVVQAAVEPFETLPVLLNTGGKNTEFASGAVPGLAATAPERRGAGVSGAPVVGSSVGAQVLLVSGHRVPVDELVVRETMHDPQGMIGIDVLRGTVLACASDPARPVVWQL